jgi:tRNA threonylcarbamoyl adenosine modification protein YeaZ
VRVLALDTSTPTTTCALLDFTGGPAGPRGAAAWEEGARVVWEKAIEPPLKAGDVLPTALGDLDGVQGIAVGVGPGSFTGLRVGLAAAKALAYARRLPIAGASSLQALALDQPALVHAATEARKGELFVQSFLRGEPASEIRIVMAEDFHDAVLRGAPPARNVARLCLARLRGADYDAQVCFALAPNYLQGFPLQGVPWRGRR